MTKEEAIRHLTSLRIHSQNRQFGKDIEALDKAVEALERSKWIPCSERLPEDGQSVLFCDIDGDIMVGYHVKGRPYTYFSHDITYADIKNVRAWMPLPEPYEEVKE